MVVVVIMHPFRTRSIECASVDDLVCLSIVAFLRLSLLAPLSKYRSVYRPLSRLFWQPTIRHLLRVLLPFLVGRSARRDIVFSVSPLRPCFHLVYLVPTYRLVRPLSLLFSLSRLLSPFLTIAFHRSLAPSADCRLTASLTRRRLRRCWCRRRGVSPVRLLVEVRVQVRYIVRLVTRSHRLCRREDGCAS